MASDSEEVSDFNFYEIIYIEMYILYILIDK